MSALHERATGRLGAQPRRVFVPRNGPGRGLARRSILPEPQTRDERQSTCLGQHDSGAVH